MAAITVWVALWWFTEPVDLAVTALLPFVLMPLFGLLTPAEVASHYMDPIIFLFLGGFMLAFAMEKWELHTRLALAVLSRTGPSPSRVLAGVMVTSFFLSMWVSNTATTLMLLPGILAVVHHFREEGATSGRSAGSDRPVIGFGLFLHHGWYDDPGGNAS